MAALPTPRAGRLVAVTVLAAVVGCGPAATPSPAAPAPASPAAAPAVTTTTEATVRPLADPLPYRADWSAGPAGWTGTDDWVPSGGQLHNDGSSYEHSAGMVAPLDLSAVGDHAVEAEIQLLRYTDAGMISGVAAFGLVVRGQDDGDGYTAGPCVSSGIFSCTSDQPGQRVAAMWSNEGRTSLDVRPFRPGEEWHRYRMEVRGNTFTVLIDGNLALTATDNTYPTGGKVGLFSRRCQVSVRSFEVTAL